MEIPFQRTIMKNRDVCAFTASNVATKAVEKTYQIFYHNI